METWNILRCPFCESDAVKVICMDHIAHVECEDCGARGPSEMNDDLTIRQLHRDAIASWNTNVKRRFVARAWELPKD